MDPILSELALSAWNFGWPEGSGSVPALVTALRLAHTRDRETYPLPVALLRSLRRARIAGARAVWPELARNPAFVSHAARTAEGDPLFFLSHRHYLARGLSASQRARAAALHYRHETTDFRPEFLRAVRLDGGLTLWSQRAEGMLFALRLTEGNDVAHEGALSVVLEADGARVCVLSFSLVPPDCPGVPGPAPLYWITRKQHAQDRGYQPAFHRAFDHAAPARLCLAAMLALARAQGHTAIAGIAGAAQPAWFPEEKGQFTRSYDQFWTEMGGVAVSPRAYRLNVPLTLPTLDSLDPAHRKRARARRRHALAVETAALAAIQPYLRPAR